MALAPRGSDVAPSGRDFTVAAKLTTTQCDHLSGFTSTSIIVSTKLFVPLGAPVQESAGEIFSPPHRGWMCAAGMTAPDRMSVLVKLIAADAVPVSRASSSDTLAADLPITGLPRHPELM